MKNILIFFDGTGNDPADAVQKREWLGLGELEDDSISNVLKLHLLFGGDLDNGNNEGDQLCFYYSGVGTHGGKIRRTINSFEVDMNQRWDDSSFPASPLGWDVDDPDIELGWFREAMIRRKEEERRIADARWFEICGAVGETEREDGKFKLLDHLSGEGANYQPVITGEFCPFANDLPDRYGNNLGYVDVTIRRIE